MAKAIWGVKGLKSCAGRDGEAFSVKLTEGGKVVASATNSGTGGMNHWHWLDKGAEARFEAFAATLPTLPMEGMDPLPQDSETALEYLINEAQDRKDCKRGTLFRESPSSVDRLFIRQPFTAEVAAMVRAKYPQAVILNERFAAEGQA